MSDNTIRVHGGTIATITAAELQQAIERAYDDGTLVEGLNLADQLGSGVKATWDADGCVLRVESTE